MRLVFGVIFFLLVGCAAPGPNRYELEFNAYVEYLKSEVRARRMTDEQAKYLAISKLNQLRAQRDAENAAQNARIGDAFQAAGGILIQPPTINCTSRTDRFTGITTTQCR